MNITPIPLAEKALQHARYLAEEIGPRPAGSLAEKQALDYVANQLADWGYRVERSPTPFAPSPPVHYPYLVGVIALAGCGWALPRFPWLALVFPFLIAALPQWTLWAARRRKPSSLTENIFACASANPTTPFVENEHNAIGRAAETNDPYPSLILCAHLDSARALPFSSRLWLRLHSRTMDIIQRVAVALSLLGVLQWVGFTMPPGLLAAGGFLAALVAGAWLFMQLWGVWRPVYSPGAVDNASGVGVLLALAEHFAGQPPPHLGLGFLFTGAEETGAHGAAAFADKLREEGTQTAVMVLDMVGAGNTLRYVVSDGVFFPRHTDPRLNRMVQTACPQARPLNETLRSGDHAAFIRRGFPTTALQTSGSAQAELAYHTVNDTTALLDPAAMEMTLQCVINICSEIPPEHV